MSAEDRDPLELLARMLVGGGYKEPSPGRCSVAPLGGPDVAGALAMMKDRLAAQVVHAVATRADDAQIAQLALDAGKRVAIELHHAGVRVLDQQQPADRHRLRLVVLAAATELVWPERRECRGVLAKRAKMRLADFIRVHAIAANVLTSALVEGRQQFARRLFGG